MNDLHLETKLLSLFGRENSAPFAPRDILRALKLPESQGSQLRKLLVRLEREGKIARLKQGDRYGLPREADLITGRIRMNRQGVGYVYPETAGSPVIRVSQDATGTAMHGDLVLVRRDVEPRPARGAPTGEPSGRVVRVLSTARKTLVGTLRRTRHLLCVIPDDPRITHDIYVAPPRDVGRPANEGDKVVVELDEWTSRHLNPEGHIVEVLGPPDAEGVDMLSVIRHYGLPLHFPKAVLKEAAQAGQEVRSSELAGRVDCRSKLVITIDPQDAKDFDDAIGLEAAPGGHWRLWVHIADVSHYVRPGSALDKEAAKRGNSTYLADRVIPMLPEALSNELCSLKPDVDRLTKCVEFLISREGRVLRSQFYPAVIHSARRLHYREAFDVLSRPPRDAVERMLHDAAALAKKIRQARFQAGSLDLDFPETKMILDDRGKVLRIEKVENDISHQLIEEFMLLANEAVAGRLMALGRPALYRVHEPPDERKLREFREEVLSHRIACGNLSDRREVQRLLAHLNRIPIGLALKINFLRSLMRARYAVEPLGHYGLAKKKYTHFTSPIRRYADLVVHRVLFEGKQPPAQASLQEVALHISETERNSDDAERDSKDVKLFAFLESQLEGRPQPYAAVVTDVRNFGFFVDVSDLGMKGLVPLSGISDDFFRFDPARVELIGRRSGRTIRLGDKVQVKVAKVDRFKKQVDFALAELPKAGPPPAPGAGRPGGLRQPGSSSDRHKYQAAADLKGRQRRPKSARSFGRGNSFRR